MSVNNALSSSRVTSPVVPRSTAAACPMRDTEDMELVLLVIPECPNSVTAKELFVTALGLEGITDAVEVREIFTQGQAELHDFHGSPSFSLDGSDLFASDAAPAVACRVYPTAAGLAGQPALEDLRRAIRAAREAPGAS
jgi:hypothetical protein